MDTSELSNSDFLVVTFLKTVNDKTAARKDRADALKALSRLLEERADEHKRFTKKRQAEDERIKKQLAKDERRKERANTAALRGRLKKFKIPEAAYPALYALGCWLCRGPFTDPSAVVLDHDHKTGKFRGLAHGHCNTIIGLAKENDDLLLSLADALYLYQQKNGKTPHTDALETT